MGTSVPGGLTSVSTTRSSSRRCLMGLECPPTSSTRSPPRGAGHSRSKRLLVSTYRSYRSNGRVSRGSVSFGSLIREEGVPTGPSSYRPLEDGETTSVEVGDLPEAHDVLPTFPVPDHQRAAWRDSDGLSLHSAPRGGRGSDPSAQGRTHTPVAVDHLLPRGVAGWIRISERRQEPPKQVGMVDLSSFQRQARGRLSDTLRKVVRQHGHVDSHTEYQVADTVIHDARLGQDAPELAPSDHQVVGPLRPYGSARERRARHDQGPGSLEGE